MMDSSGLSTLNFIFPLHRFRCRASFFRPPFLLSELKKKRNLSLSSFSPPPTLQCSYDSETSGENSLPNGVGEAVTDVSHNKLLQVVLVSPQIPGNTGCIARTCAASAVGLHLVEEGTKRLLAFTKRGAAIHSDFAYRGGDWLVFGSETSGLPPEALFDCKSETFGGGTIRIPMVETYVRCLNLSVSVGIALYEASRQLNYEQLQFTSETCIDSEGSLITEDIFA